MSALLAKATGSLSYTSVAPRPFSDMSTSKLISFGSKLVTVTSLLMESLILLYASLCAELQSNWWLSFRSSRSGAVNALKFEGTHVGMKGSMSTVEFDSGENRICFWTYVILKRS